MPSEKKGSQSQQQQQSQRDTALVNILERLSNQIQQFDSRLTAIEKHQVELPASMERVGMHQSSRFEDTDSEIKKLHDAFMRYRNDMLKLVNETDHLEESMKSLSKRQDTIAAAQEDIGQDTKNLVERFDAQEKVASDHFEFSVRQVEVTSRDIVGVNLNTTKLFVDAEKRFDAVIKEVGGVNSNTNKLFTGADKRFETLSKEIEGVNRNAKELFTDTEKRLAGIDGEIEGVNRNAAKLHVETERNIKDELRDVRRQVEELRKETMRRLLALDGMESALDVLLIRTAPPEKKPFFVIRIFRKAVKLFSVKIPDFFSKSKLWLRELPGKIIGKFRKNKQDEEE